MTNSDPSSTSRSTGTGEFQRKNLHVLATVEIAGGVIRSLGFACAEGGDPPGARDVVETLTGKSVSEALEWFEGEDEASRDPAMEVLLEAFHRAVETCLDQQ
ncbi:MAG: hypothetical protein R6V85_16570 [Polyangia bacterium]